jgi:hypothetical protein
MPFEKIYAVRDLLHREQSRFIAIVKVSGVVGNLVGQVDELRFKRRLLIKQIIGDFGIVRGVVIVRVLDNALADFERKIQPAESRVTQLEVFNNA